jgi:hypothetical protein
VKDAMNDFRRSGRRFLAQTDCGNDFREGAIALMEEAFIILEPLDGLLARDDAFLALGINLIILAAKIEFLEFPQAIFEGEWGGTKGERLVGIIRPIVPVEGLAGIEREGEFLIQIMGGDEIGNRFRANRFTDTAKLKGDAVDDPPAGIDEGIRRDEGRGGDALKASLGDAASDRGFLSWICELLVRGKVFRMGCRRLRLTRLAGWAAGVAAREAPV